MNKKRLVSLIISFMLVINLFISTTVTSNAQQTVSVGVYSTSGVFCQSVSIPYSNGDTAYSILAKTGLGITKTGGGGSVYVSGINGLSEFDEGPASGWVYAVNGYKPETSAGAYPVNAGDKIVWHYTLNYGADIGNSISKLNTFVANNSKPNPEPPKQPQQEEPSKPEPPQKTETQDIPNNNTNSNNESSKNTSTNDDEDTDKDKSNEKENEDKEEKNDKKENLTQDTKISKENVINAAKEEYKKEINSQWEAMVLHLLGEEVSKDYIENIILKEIKSNNGKYNTITELEKNILLLNKLGYNVTDIEGINLLECLITSENIEKQGSNGVIFALISLNSINKEIVKSIYDKDLENVWTTDKLIETILSYQNEDGGFSLVKGNDSSIDITAMAISSLATNLEFKGVKESIDRSVEFLNASYKESGGFKSDGKLNSESLAQVIIALTYLNMDPSNFNEVNLVEELLKYKTDDNKFSHLLGEESNNMATEQANLALIAYDKYLNSESLIYENFDVKPLKSEIKNSTKKIENKKSYTSLYIAAGAIVLCAAGYMIYRTKRNK